MFSQFFNSHALFPGIITGRCLWTRRVLLLILWPIMFSLFRKKPKHDPEDLVRERWKTSFRNPRECRFTQETGPGYSSSLDCGRRDGSLSLTLEKKDLFAWTENPLYRYRDFSLTGRIHFRSSGYCAAGFLFRFVDSKTFYYFLVSNRGFFRLDGVFNGTPFNLVPWTSFDLPREGGVFIRITASGGKILCSLEETWAAEIEDERIDAGKICFAAQNFSESDSITVSLSEAGIESRPIEVEALYERYTSYIPVDPKARIVLAESLYAAGQYSASLVQLKKAMKEIPLSGEEYLLLSDCFMNLGLYSEGLKAADKALALSPENESAAVEKAHLLYLLNRFDELRTYTAQLILSYPENHILLNLAGHGEFSLGNWPRAGEYYEKAFKASPATAIYGINAARAAARDGRLSDALSFYLSAGWELLRQEAYNDLDVLLTESSGLADKSADLSAEYKSLKGKYLFSQGRIGEATQVFKGIDKNGEGDSSVWFLLGLGYSQEGKRDKGIKFLKKAAEADPDIPVYWFKLAEQLFLSNNVHYKELDRALEKARDLAPEDCWVLNLSGQMALRKGNTEDAVRFFQTAHSLAPQEEDILINYCHALAEFGDPLKALLMLSEGEVSSGKSNQKGNILISLERYEEAQEAYEEACLKAPGSVTFRENLAEAALLSGNINKAEELYVLLNEEKEEARYFFNIGVIAKRKGEFKRALYAYQEAVKREPENYFFRESLVRQLLALEDYASAKEEAEKLSALQPEGNGKNLLLTARAYLEKPVSCSSCGQTWWIPKVIPPQEGIKLIGEPLPESPAGMCEKCGKIFCVSCATPYLSDNRFTCPDCGTALKLNDPQLRYIAKRFLNG